ncbi:MAG: hypothetical protein M1826_001574, partial [Phylliscum demangeonii]
VPRGFDGPERVRRERESAGSWSKWRRGAGCRRNAADGGTYGSLTARRGYADAVGNRKFSETA